MPCRGAFAARYIYGASVLYLILDLYLAVHPRNLMHYYTLKYNFESAINPPQVGKCRGAIRSGRRIAPPPARITKQIDQDWNRPSRCRCRCLPCFLLASACCISPSEHKFTSFSARLENRMLIATNGGNIYTGEERIAFRKNGGNQWRMK